MRTIVLASLFALGCSGTDFSIKGDGGGDEGSTGDAGPDGAGLNCMAPKANCSGNPADGCNIDESTDPNNCGGCGISCTGGSCAGGVCSLLPPGTTPPKVGDFACLAIDKASVYWATGLQAMSGGAIYKVPLSGGMPQLVVGMQQNPHGIASNGTNLFWTTLPGSIMKSDVNGMGATAIVSNQMGPTWLVIDATNVYWSNATDGSVWKAGQDGSNPTKLAAIGQGHAGRLAVDQTSVYFTDSTGGNVYSVPIAGAPQPTAIASQQASPRDVAVAGGFLYFSNGGSNMMTNGNISKLQLGGSNMPMAIVPNLVNPTGIASDGTNVWWAASQMAGAIDRSSAMGGAVTQLATNQTYPNCIALDAKSIYWINEGGGAVAKAAK
jgi:hypothetical protein